MSAVDAWPFLIGHGRRRGYTVLAAPGFLVRDREEGFLEGVVGPSPNSVAERVVDSPRGRRLCLVWADQRVRGDEVGEVDDLVDEHSRPLRLLHGFVCQDAAVSDPDPADITRSLDTALATYRRFLHDEEAFTVEESAPFPVAMSGATPSPTAPPPPSIRAVVLLGGALTVALLVLAASLWLTSGPESPAEPRVLVGQTVNGTIETAGQEDHYVLDTGTTTCLTLADARPADLAVRLTHTRTGKRPAPNHHGCWAVTAHTTPTD